jgi:hypothetical protein
VRFHDGTQFSAADVVWTYGGLIDGSLASAKRGAYAPVESVAALDEHTVDFVTRQPFGAMLGNLTAYVAVVPAGRTPRRSTASRSAPERSASSRAHPTASRSRRSTDSSAAGRRSTASCCAKSPTPPCACSSCARVRCNWW